MKIVRALFIGGYRIKNACISLHFDHYLQGIDETYVFTDHKQTDDIKNILTNQGHDVSAFKFVHDRELLTLFPTISNWHLEGDPRGGWLYQQALKLAAFEYIDADIILIQDPDTFCIEPYSCYEDGMLNYFVLPNVTEAPAYYDVLQPLLGIERQTPDSFVSEFAPMFKEDWVAMRNTVEQRTGKDVFTGILDAIPAYDFDGLKWFSEYEFMGNWVMATRGTKTTVQNRFECHTIDKLDNLTTDYNCVCDYIDEYAYNWGTGTVTHYAEIMDKLKKFI